VFFNGANFQLSKNKIKGLRGKSTGLVFINFDRKKHCIPKEEAKQYLKSSPRYMMEFLDYLREHYGSSRGYLMEIGLSYDEIEQLVENFTI